MVTSKIQPELQRWWARAAVAACAAVGALLPVPGQILPSLSPTAVAASLPAPTQVADPCTAPVNPIVCENSKPGTPKENWFVEGSYGDIFGYATQQSAQPGERLDFKVRTPSSDYTIEIHRLGWYQGNGARQVATLTPTATLPQAQPECLYDGTTGLVDCGNWAVSANWQIPADAVPGFYVANFVRNDAPGANQYPFVVRKDSSNADIVVQTSDQTWQAYNQYGDRPDRNFNLYVGGFSGTPDGRALKVSYNRPYINTGTASYLNAEYPLVRWLERNGYDVTYLSGIDVTRNPALLRNHDVYISSGHDEYVNGPQRAGIEAARAAGVHMMFLSGNEMFWKTRFEPSIDGSNTGYRTLACYKETKSGTKIDPSPAWTGTWRDPRLSPPSDGGRPENAVTGTLFEVNGFRNDTIQVPALYGRNRFWRNTPIATASETTSLPQGTLGYEWDTDPDNGFRPAGAIRLSETTVTMPAGDFVLKDYGNTYGTGTKTHHLMLYRDPASRALVFGSGTVQWSWGLDPEHLYPHDVPFAPASPAMQQATVNLLADMGVQPGTLQSGLVAASASADLTGPVVTVTSPTTGSTVAAGSNQAITGSAMDLEGVVASVEVSTDGGTTWKRATGLANWTYQWTPGAQGPATIKVRAADDSANLGQVATVDLTVGAQQCPCTVFGTQIPTNPDGGDPSAVELGMKFTTTVNATVTGMRFYKSAANTGAHSGSLWTATGQQMATGTFANETASGWQVLNFATPVQVRANTTYVVSYTAPAGHYSADSQYFNGQGAGIAPLTAPSNQSAGGQGVFRNGAGFPNSSFGATNYWVDVIVTTDGADNTPPTITGASPAENAIGVPTDTDVTATFSEPVDPASVQFTLTGAGGAAVPGTVTVDGNTVTFTSSNLLAASTAHTATVMASDGFGNPLASPKTWIFTTGTGPGGCPCTLFRSAQPTRAEAADTGHVELGIKFTTSANAMVTGVRFYKGAGNTGTHTGSLWNTTGTLLATGTFTNETASGWQTLTFAEPIPVRAERTYIASYRAPNGHYAADQGYFANTGAGRGLLTAPSSPAAGGQGVFRYGGGFPDSSFADTNYWVDVIVNTAGVDTTAPSVTGTDPPANATGVPTGSSITATFSEQVDPASVQFTVTNGGAPVAGATGVGADLRTVTFTSTDYLAGTTTYTASVTAEDNTGNAMASPHVWSFTTAATGACPCSLFRGGDTPATFSTDSALELGMRWTPAVDGWVTAIRFYKSLGDTGAHTGTLWTAGGQQLATGSFSGETTSGWQTLQLSTPVQVSAGSSYVVSYHSFAGHYASTANYFTAARTIDPLTAPADGGGTPNGVYRYGPGGDFPNDSFRATNYWVDVVFTTTQP